MTRGSSREKGPECWDRNTIQQSASRFLVQHPAFEAKILDPGFPVALVPRILRQSRCREAALAHMPLETPLPRHESNERNRGMEFVASRGHTHHLPINGHPRRRPSPTRWPRRREHAVRRAQRSTLEGSGSLVWAGGGGNAAYTAAPSATTVFSFSTARAVASATMSNSQPVCSPGLRSCEGSVSDASEQGCELLHAYRSSSSTVSRVCGHVPAVQLRRLVQLSREKRQYLAASARCGRRPRR